MADNVDMIAIAERGLMPPPSDFSEEMKGIQLIPSNTLELAMGDKCRPMVVKLDKDKAKPADGTYRLSLIAADLKAGKVIRREYDSFADHEGAVVFLVDDLEFSETGPGQYQFFMRAYAPGTPDSDMLNPECRFYHLADDPIDVVQSRADLDPERFLEAKPEALGYAESVARIKAAIQAGGQLHS